MVYRLDFDPPLFFRVKSGVRAISGDIVISDGRNLFDILKDYFLVKTRDIPIYYSPHEFGEITRYENTDKKDSGNSKEVLLKIVVKHKKAHAIKLSGFIKDPELDEAMKVKADKNSYLTNIDKRNIPFAYEYCKYNDTDTCTIRNKIYKFFGDGKGSITEPGDPEAPVGWVPDTVSYFIIEEAFKPRKKRKFFDEYGQEVFPYPNKMRECDAVGGSTADLGYIPDGISKKLKRKSDKLSEARSLLKMCEDVYNSMNSNPNSPGNKVIARTPKGEEVSVEDAENAVATLNNLTNAGKLSKSMNTNDLDKKIADIVK